jgi:hypothetical protein
MGGIILLDGASYRPVTGRADFRLGKRMFYELGTYTTWTRAGGWQDWRSSGKFKEILDPVAFADQDEYLDDPAYLAHHNFYVQV